MLVWLRVRSAPVPDFVGFITPFVFRAEVCFWGILRGRIAGFDALLEGGGKRER